MHAVGRKSENISVVPLVHYDFEIDQTMNPIDIQSIESTAQLVSVNLYNDLQLSCFWHNSKPMLDPPSLLHSLNAPQDTCYKRRWKT